MEPHQPTEGQLASLERLKKVLPPERLPSPEFAPIMERWINNGQIKV